MIHFPLFALLMFALYSKGLLMYPKVYVHFKRFMVSSWSSFQKESFHASCAPSFQVDIFSFQVDIFRELWMSRGLWRALSFLPSCFMVFILLFTSNMGSIWRGTPLLNHLHA